jgi:phage-related protein
MKISIRSKNGADLSAFDRKVIKMATVFYANQLMSPRLAKSLDIKINIHHDYNNQTGFLGDVVPLDEGENPRPKEFEINLDRQYRLKKILISLGHEMVHVKQYAKCELKFHDTKDVVTFQKKKYKDDNYWESPWEIEAYGREPGLWQKFKPIYQLLLLQKRK